MNEPDAVIEDMTLFLVLWMERDGGGHLDRAIEVVGSLLPTCRSWFGTASAWSNLVVVSTAQIIAYIAITNIVVTNVVVTNVVFGWWGNNMFD